MGTVEFTSYEDFIENINSQTLRAFIYQYQCWLEKQLKAGGLVFTPEEFYNMKLFID